MAAYYESFLALTGSIRQLDQQLAEHEKNEPRAARLRTMPKVSRIASLTFLAAVDDVNRVPTSRKLVGHSGLAPTVRQSGERTEYGAISREGRCELRAVWVQIAQLVATDKKRATQPLRTWFNRVAKKRGKNTALVALARRLLVIACQLLKSETDYDAARLKKKRRAARQLSSCSVETTLSDTHPPPTNPMQLEEEISVSIVPNAEPSEAVDNEMVGGQSVQGTVDSSLAPRDNAAALLSTGPARFEQLTS